jgi:hypothetical protein
MSGDENLWMIMDKDEVTGSFYSNEDRTIKKSSLKC